MPIKLGAQLLTLRGQFGKSRRCHGFEVLGLFRQPDERFVDMVAQRLDLSFAGLPEFVEALETADHLLDLAVRGATGIGDVVGDVLGRAGDHRKLAAQLLHVFERGHADLTDQFNARTVFDDQRL